ncbi:outer membrane protein [Xanthobacter aminoxidans]|uniref:outer membrane protein n=1 Tax=Xanthobacter aminoxidans TaxID=186280 RepID=UPI003728ED3F
MMGVFGRAGRLLLASLAIAALAGTAFASAAHAADKADAEMEAMMASLGKPGDFSLAAPAVSEDAAAGWYFRADVGYVPASSASLSYLGLPTGLDVSGAGWSLGGGIGYRFLPFLRAEVSLDYLSLGSASLSPFGPGVGASATVGLASVYWDIITLAGFTPYLSAGAGFAINTLNAPAGLQPAGNSWEFAWSAGAGVSFAVSSSFSLDLGYRYLDLGSPAYAGGLSLGNSTAQQVRFGLRYAL